MTQTYLCPRCRADATGYDCARHLNTSPDQAFELHATLTFPVPTYRSDTDDTTDGPAAARRIADLLTENPAALSSLLHEALDLGEYTVRVQAVYHDTDSPE